MESKISSFVLSIAILSMSAFFLVGGTVDRAWDASGLASTQAEVFVIITTEDILFKPDFFKVNPGDTVRVRITQQDSVLHTFTLAREANRVLPTDWTHEQLHDYFHDNNLTDVWIPAGPGAVVWANFTAPSQVGRYEYVCLIPGHFPRMVGFMQVGEPPTESLSPAAIAGIAIAAVAVVAVAVALALRGRKKRGPGPPLQ